MSASRRAGARQTRAAPKGGALPRVKICGVTRPEDGRFAEEAGADYVGTILVPGSPRQVAPERAREIADAIDLPLVVVTSEVDAEGAARQAGAAGARVVQVHAEWSRTEFAALRALGDWELWAVVRVRTKDDVTRGIERTRGAVDLLLFDGWHASGLGGTGSAFSWDALGSARGAIGPGVSVGVAGGLGPENVAEAVARTAPDLVDVASGVEASPGVKDPARVRKFIEEARGAGRATGAGARERRGTDGGMRE